MYRFLLFLLFLISPLVHSAEISDFKFGLACTDGKTFGWICYDAEEIHVTGQGQCVFDGEEKPCTWYGYSFRYSGFSEETKFKCKFSTSIESNYGNPWEVVAENSRGEEYELDVGMGEGYFFNPQFSVFRVVDKADVEPKYKRTTCTLDGEQVAEFEYRIIYPVNPKITK